VGQVACNYKPESLTFREGEWETVNFGDRKLNSIFIPIKFRDDFNGRPRTFIVNKNIVLVTHPAYCWNDSHYGRVYRLTMLNDDFDCIVYGYDCIIDNLEQILENMLEEKGKFSTETKCTNFKLLNVDEKAFF